MYRRSDHLLPQAVIFCNTKKKVDWLTNKMRQANFTVSAMHGDMPQKEREAIMAEFRNGDSRVLIVTDVWARGLDVQQVSLVINYDLPNSAEDFVHRVGRAAHGVDASGDAWTFIWTRDLDAWYRLSALAGVTAHPEKVEGFVPTAGASRSQAPFEGVRPKSGRGRRPGPGRRKRASRPIAPDQKPGRGVR